MEISILDWIQSMRTPIGDVVVPLITRLGDAGMIWILLSVVLLLNPRTRKSGTILAAALCVDVVLCNGILKNLFGRIRPCDVNTSIQLLIARPDDFSFPSGHTAASFAAVAALYFAGEKKRPKGRHTCMPEKNGNREEIMGACIGACGFHSVFKAVFICALSY